ncbi:hypothetical protein EVAR_70250_1 [Eumeta japonica]|uniref:Uncharacterized protein n=1 Tax=Eumeta variegata TaxID=151549 RepID=A0A4C2A3G1_EUMVA|nr:hypothetical protein EVAR_70250_1 [Eumeta japonica]
MSYTHNLKGARAAAGAAGSRGAKGRTLENLFLYPLIKLVECKSHNANGLETRKGAARFGRREFPRDTGAPRAAPVARAL